MKKRWNGRQARHLLARNCDRSRTLPSNAESRSDSLHEFIADCSEPAELVCDPYSGSGSTGLECVQFGQRFLGWERDRAVATLAQRRLAGFRAIPVPGQIKMFG